MLLVNAFSKENEASPKKESRKSGKELICTSLGEVFDRLTTKKNQMARVEIMQVLVKHEFANRRRLDQRKDIKGFKKILQDF